MTICSRNSVLLGVNIDHVATLRQARGNTLYPDPVQAALWAEAGGADGITLHLREDRRHIQDRDVLLVKEILSTRMNLEMAITEEMLLFAERLKPTYCCLVPERRQELTTEDGLNVSANKVKIQAACQRLLAAGIEVSLFIDPDLKQIEAAKQCGAAIIEIHTGHYTIAATKEVRQHEYQRVVKSVELGLALGLQVNAGHGLNYQNVEAIAAIPGIFELNIGHSIISQAVFCGLQAAVRKMKDLIKNSSTISHDH